MTTTTTPETTARRRKDVEPLLEVKDLVVEYRTGPHSSVRAVRNVNFELYPGESMALVGESGCGKTTLGLGLLRLLPRLGSANGEVLFRTQDGNVLDVLKLRGNDLRHFRWNEAAMVFQGAMNAFNPVIRIRDHMEDTLRAHGRYTKKQVEDKACDLLQLVRLEPKRVMNSYPHELSGGMRQRVLIAMSLLLDPQLLVLDEPTTALDILTQRSIVDVLHDVRERLQFAMIFISHDLALAAELADRVSTMYAGAIIERGSVRDIFYRPRHPYSLALINSVPPIVGDLPTMESIPGGPPSLASLPSGCTFHPRCRFADEGCKQSEPQLELVRDKESDEGHDVACFNYEQVHLDRSGRASVEDLVAILGEDAIDREALEEARRADQNGDGEGSAR